MVAIALLLSKSPLLLKALYQIVANIHNVELVCVVREGLYKALSSNTKPRYETLQKVLSALGFGFSIEKRL